MRSPLTRLPLVCPACRRQTERGLELFTLEPVFEPGALAVEEAGQGTRLLDGVVACQNAACGRRYPVVDGIPVVVADPSFFTRELAAIVEASDVRLPVAAALAALGPDDAPAAWQAEHLGYYLDAHWGDRAAPPPLDADGQEHFGLAPLVEKLAARAAVPVAAQLELGCSVGRALATLAPAAPLTVGLDLQVAALRRARRILDGEPVPYLRRRLGRHYEHAVVRPLGPTRAVHLVGGDALDPPFVPATFDRIVALHLVDAVRDPAQLLVVMDVLLRPGGELLLASPYQWQSTHVDEAARPREADAARWLRRTLTDGTGLAARYVVEDEAELPWRLRRDERSTLVYRTHYLRARKPARP